MYKKLVRFSHKPANTELNFYFRTLITEDEHQRDQWLEQTNKFALMTITVHKPKHQSHSNKDSLSVDISSTKSLYESLINFPYITVK